MLKHWRPGNLARGHLSLLHRPLIGIHRPINTYITILAKSIIYKEPILSLNWIWTTYFPWCFLPRLIVSNGLKWSMPTQLNGELSLLTRCGDIVGIPRPEQYFLQLTLTPSHWEIKHYITDNGNNTRWHVRNTIETHKKYSGDLREIKWKHARNTLEADWSSYSCHMVANSNQIIFEDWIKFIRKTRWFHTWILHRTSARARQAHSSET